MSVNFFRGSKSFFVSYANDDDADALFGNFVYHIDGNHDFDTGKVIYKIFMMKFGLKLMSQKRT